LRRGHSHADAVRDAFQRGLYASQVARLLDHVARDRLLVLTYEEVRADTTGAFERTLAFLGLDQNGVEAPVMARRPHDHEAQIVRELPEELLVDVAARYKQDVALLARLLPDVDLGNWTSLGAPRDGDSEVSESGERTSSHAERRWRPNAS
jgi:hypothetical protein